MAAVWDDGGVEWSEFDLVVVRSTWDYPDRRDEVLSFEAVSYTHLTLPTTERG